MSPIFNDDEMKDDNSADGASLAASELSEKQLDAVAGGHSQGGWNVAKNVKAA
jgi:hypothetical protein